MDLIQLHKKYLLEKHGKRPEDLNPTETALGAVAEIGELALNKDFLPWKKNNDRDNILEEIVDLQFFVLELALRYGIESFKEIEELYVKKLGYNMERPDHDWK